MQISLFLTRPQPAIAFAVLGLLPFIQQAGMAAQPATAVPLYTFPGQPGGRRADARLIQAGDGYFYGVTEAGGSSDFGEIFRMTPAGVVTILDSFGTGANDGRYPAGPLVEGLDSLGRPNGIFYGVTLQGGDHDKGAVYMLAPDAGRATKYAISYLYSFTGGADGGAPQGGLTIGRTSAGLPDGYVYGTTSAGGVTNSTNTIGAGVIFRMTTNGFVESIIHSFALTGNNLVNVGGAVPRGALLQYHNASGWGQFFGTASAGGSGGQGTVYSITKTGQFVTLHDFQFTTDGQFPVSGLAQDGAGVLYGTTHDGGSAGVGSIYRLIPTAANSTGFAYSQFVSLGSDNASPSDSLIFASNSKLYGTASSGGSSSNGSVFRIDVDPASPTGASAKVVYDFTKQAIEGRSLPAGVMQGTDGDLYGVTDSGGSGGSGTIFRLNVGAPPTIKQLAPAISSAEYHVNGDGSSYIIVGGANYQPGLQFLVTRVQTGATVTKVTLISPSQIRADLHGLLLAGAHSITITNPDKQTVTHSLTTLNPPIVTGVTAITDKSGVHVVVTGFNFGTPGFNNSIAGSQIAITDKDGNVVDRTLMIEPKVPAHAGAAQQAILSLSSPNDGGGYHAVVFNADGQNSNDPQPGATANVSRGRSKALPLLSNEFQVYTKDQTTYNVIMDPNVGKNLSLYDWVQLVFSLTGWHPPLVIPDTQMLVGQVNFLSTVPKVNVAALGVGTSLTGLISQDGGGLISQDGGGLISQDGGGLISQDGGGVISNDGGSLISQDGGGLASLPAGSFLPVSSAIGPVAAGGSLNGSLALTPVGLIASGGGNITGNRFSVSPRIAPPASVTFNLTRHDQGPQAGTESAAGKVTIVDAKGNSTLILEIVYTPGKPDLIDYRAPGVTVTPTHGTPAPTVTNPSPTLTTISPSTVTAGGPAFTITANGSLFTDSAKISINGQALATTVISGNQLTAQISASLIAAVGSLQVKVVNPTPGGGASAALALTVKSAVTTPTVVHVFPAGLQLLSVPDDYSAVSLSAALGVSSPKLAVWAPDALQYTVTPAAPADKLRPGQGYWARFTQATNLYDLGVPTSTMKPFAITLKNGWNMIGDPFPKTVSLAGVTVQSGAQTYTGLDAASKAGVVGFTLYGYAAGANGYQKVTGSGSIAPYAGYWIYANQSCTLQIPAQ